MTPAPRTHPIGDTLEAQATLSFEDIACLLRTSSEKMIFSDDVPSYDDMIPSNVDVLCGRDREAHGHVGNRKFRVMISWYRNKYQNAKCRDEKTRFTNEIVASIRACGGRFLKKNEKTNIWYDVGDEYAHEKVSHALRSAKDPEKKCQRKKQKVTNQPPTPEEDHAFQTLLEKQKRIFRSLLEENQASIALDFEENEDYWGSISV